MHKEKEENGLLSHMHHHDAYRSRELSAFEHSLSDGDMFLQVSALIVSVSVFFCFVHSPFRIEEVDFNLHLRANPKSNKSKRGDTQRFPLV